MHQMEPASFGYRITLSGVINAADIEEIRISLIDSLSAHYDAFSLLIDLRTMVPLGPEVAQAMEDILKASTRMSMKRAVTIVESPVVKGQIAQISSKVASMGID